MSIRNTLSLKHLIEMHAYWEHHKMAPLSNAKAVGLLKHIRKEIVEIAKTPEDTRRILRHRDPCAVWRDSAAVRGSSW